MPYYISPLNKKIPIMNNDLIFYAVSRRKWPELSKNGKFTPQSYGSGENSDDIKLECSTAESLKEYLDANYQGRKNLLLLVIDKSRLVNRAVLDNDKQRAFIEKSINLDAILDKIKISCNESGLFDITIDTD